GSPWELTIMVNLFKFYGPKKVIGFAASLLLAVALFIVGRHFKPVGDFVLSLGYPGLFVAGFFYVYSFTGLPALALLLMLGRGGHYLLAVPIAAAGAFVGDLLMFFFFRHVFESKRGKSKYEKAADW